MILGEGVLMKTGKVYDDIFEAIRCLSPNDALLNLKDRFGQGTLRQNPSFEMMGMPNGKFVMLPRNSFLPRFFRGERAQYPTCIPSIYRMAAEETILVRRLKIIDFSLIAQTFPQIYYAEHMDIDVDMLALAQHYELHTDFLDLTSDISVAAFFAVTNFDRKSKQYYPMSGGIGVIRTFHYFPTPDYFESGKSAFRYVGLQPFERPGRQCAFGIQLEPEQTLESLCQGTKVYFYHRKEQNEKILNIFGNQEHNNLFPPELIADVAKSIKLTNSVTKKAVHLYCEENGAQETEVNRVLQELRCDITDKPIFRLTRKQFQRLQTDFRNRPFGNAKVYSRLMYLP